MEHHQATTQTERESKAVADVRQNVEFFQTIPWTRKLLETGLFKPRLTSYRTFCESGEDTFFHDTLNTSATFSHWFWLARVPSICEYLTKADQLLGASAMPTLSRLDTVILVEVGAAMWGFKHTMHGGVICALLDQALSLCASQHQQASKPSTATLYTADLSVKFRTPVIVPAVLAV
jgi:hypothetical protein